MPHVRGCRFLIALLVAAALGTLWDNAWAQEEKDKQDKAEAAPLAVPLKYHPWATFSPGAWKCVRVLTETYDEDGSVASTGETETTTVLTKVEPDGVTLEVEVVVWVGGRRLDPQPQTVWQGLWGQSKGQTVAVKPLEPAELTVEGRAIPCNVRQLEIFGPDQKLVESVKVYCNDNVFPYILRRESVTSEGENGAKNQTDMVVDALDMPVEVDVAVVASATHFRTVHRHSRGVTLALTYTSDKVPGGIVYDCSKELDSQGRLIRRSVVELLGFGLEPNDSSEDDSRLRRRPIRGARFRKSFRADE